MSLSQLFWIIAAILIGLAYLGVPIYGWLIGIAFLAAGAVQLLESFAQPVVLRRTND